MSLVVDVEVPENERESTGLGLVTAQESVIGRAVLMI
jgi:hypothetical protein